MNRINYDTAYKFAWLMCIITLPLPTPVTSFFNLVLIAVWMVDLNYKQKWRRLTKAKWIIPFLLFFILHLIGITYSEHVNTGFFEIEKKLAFLSIPIIIASGRPLTSSDISFLKKGFILSCLAIVIASLVVVAVTLLSSMPPAPSNFDTLTNSTYHLLNPVSSIFWEYFSYIQLGSWIGLHPSYFSMYLIFCIVILIQRMIEQIKINFTGLALIVLFTLFIGLLSSRMAMIAYVTVLFWLPIQNAIMKSNYKIMMVPTLSVMVLVSLVLINPVSRFRILQEPISTSYTANENTKIWNSVSFRLLEWKASVSELNKSWIAGVGSGDGQAALQNYYQKYGDEVAALHYNAHNQYLQTTLELGLPGLIMLLICIGLPLFKGASLFPEHVAFIFLFALMCFTESMLAAQKGILFFTLFQSLYIRCNQP